MDDSEGLEFFQGMDDSEGLEFFQGMDDSEGLEFFQGMEDDDFSDIIERIIQYYLFHFSISKIVKIVKIINNKTKMESESSLKKLKSFL